MIALSPQPTSRFVQYLLDNEVILSEQLETTRSIDAISLLSALWEIDEVDQEKLAKAIADYLHLPYFPDETLSIKDDIRHLLARVVSEPQAVLPLQRQNGAIHIAVSNPFDLELRDRLESMVGEVVELAVASPAAIGRVLGEKESSVNHLEYVTDGLNQRATIQQGTSSIDALQDIDENSAPVVKLVNTLFSEAVSKKVSDIHIEHQPHSTVIRYRIDGVLRAAMEPMARHYHEPIISRIKVMSELDITERHIPQDGRLRVEYEHGGIDFRVSILPGIEGEDAVIRVLDRRAVHGEEDGIRFSNLGFNSNMLGEFRRVISNPSGMIIVAGPTGSGKTTTLYAAINELDQVQGKTITIEDPIEYRLSGILQIPVNEKKRLTFSRGLRSILRHDPDRIMVGEIRDKETAEIAVQSALTGHLLFTTVHANSALDVINRFTHMGINPGEVIPSLACIVSQRLVRKICISCKQENPPEVELLQEMGVTPSDVENWKFYEGKGCDSCGGTGYSGRTIVAELLRITPAVAHQLIEGCTISEVREAAQKDGMLTIMSNALEKVKDGTTSLREIRRILGAV